MPDRNPEHAKRMIEPRRLLWAEFMANYRYKTFENWLIAEVMRLRKPEADLRADERGRVLAEIEKWILHQVGDTESDKP